MCSLANIKTRCNRYSISLAGCAKTELAPMPNIPTPYLDYMEATTYQLKGVYFTHYIPRGIDDTTTSLSPLRAA